MPEMSEYVEAAKENVRLWEQYEETQEDKEVYKPKKGSAVWVY